MMMTRRANKMCSKRIVATTTMTTCSSDSGATIVPDFRRLQTEEEEEENNNIFDMLSDDVLFYIFQIVGIGHYRYIAGTSQRFRIVYSMVVTPSPPTLLPKINVKAPTPTSTTTTTTTTTTYMSSVVESISRSTLFLSEVEGESFGELYDDYHHGDGDDSSSRIRSYNNRYYIQCFQKFAIKSNMIMCIISLDKETTIGEKKLAKAATRFGNLSLLKQLIDPFYVYEDLYCLRKIAKSTIIKAAKIKKNNNIRRRNDDSNDDCSTKQQQQQQQREEEEDIYIWLQSIIKQRQIYLEKYDSNNDKIIHICMMVQNVIFAFIMLPVVTGYLSLLGDRNSNDRYDEDECFYFLLVGVFGVFWMFLTFWLLYVRPLFQSNPSLRWYAQQLVNHTFLAIIAVVIGYTYIDDYMEYIQIIMKAIIIDLPSIVAAAIMSNKQAVTLYLASSTSSQT